MGLANASLSTGRCVLTDLHKFMCKTAHMVGNHVIEYSALQNVPCKQHSYQARNKFLFFKGYFY